MDYFDQPPPYAGSASSPPTLVASPAYSSRPGQSECLIRLSSDVSVNSCISPADYVYRTKNLQLSLGRKIWGTSTPIFGSGAVVEGKITLSGELKNISSITIHLGGRVVNKYTERGLVTGATSTEILSTTTALKPSASGVWDTEHVFVLPFPIYTLGRRTRLPPSMVSYQAGVTCETTYKLKVTVARKGLRLNDRQELKVPILYLPRTFATRPLIRTIPDVIIDPTTTALKTDLEGIKVIQLQPLYKSRSVVNPQAPSVVLALPSSLSFASQDTVPLTLNIVSPNAPVISKILLSAVKIQLVKHNMTWLKKANSYSTMECVIGTADIVHIDECREGVSILSCELRAKHTVVRQSWSVENVAEQQYHIHVSVRPPSSTANHVPYFEYEQPIEMTTDAYDSPERAVAALGGVPSPAVGMQTVTRYGSRRGAAFR